MRLGVGLDPAGYPKLSCAGSPNVLGVGAAPSLTTGFGFCSVPTAMIRGAAGATGLRGRGSSLGDVGGLGFLLVFGLELVPSALGEGGGDPFFLELFGSLAGFSASRGESARAEAEPEEEETSECLGEIFWFDAV